MTTTYWNRYALGAANAAPDDESAPSVRWTQYPSHGPGIELLGDPRSSLELGCGRGDAVAALAARGVDATGVDLSGTQCEQARRRWGHVAGARFEHADVLEFLGAADRTWDAIYSIWGAIWFLDPALVLPLVRKHLAPGGKLVFSHAPPVPGAYGIQGMYGAAFTADPLWVYRWSYEPDVWAELLRRNGFGNIHARVEAAPESGKLGTLIVEAERRPGPARVSPHG
ncbi:class I SAM-dependent methyltransferase [Amycolatopsis saalfeldensis]|uniref:Ubiquinone/menaquinone biosynthesis C-methylase UbiE n=1 Tax=Amycolatopsis saalfeldensis TaxID=394193 RepID=A0A1H8YQ82_9PSEU|nr:class I SAM-dependent methyltransferase [Amycolatopsis saalfeldensis]SEP54289.1 Ubiquinone/menaquinone biosynthesis C-methylase UbiE [Amycolatopsis saalfeldensis]